MAIDGDNGRTSTVGGGNTGYNWSGYAEWLAKTKNSTKTCNLIVNYYANGYNGSAAENPPPSSVRSYTGQSVDVRLVVEVASGDTMSNPGYVFVGWATSNNTATITYNPGDTISNSWAADYRGNSVTNLYAVWTNQNVITYNPDDNSIEKSAIYQVKQSGQSATLKGATFTRTGYTQTGWATTAGGPKVYNLGGTYSSNNPLSLYPVWQANTYTITYVANEGTGTMADQTVTYDSTFTPRACSFTREGYSFSSWNESQDGKGIRWKVQEYTVDRAENITLYAIWKGNEYTVYYDDNYSRYSDEITGDIVSFESEYAQPLKKAEVSLSPIQDLHGYSNPWPAGGGKNKLSLSSVSLGGDEPRTKRIAIEPIAAGTYKMSGVNTGTATTDIGFQFFDAISGGTTVGNGYLGGTLTLTGEAVSVYCYMSTADYNNGKTVIIGNMQIEAGNSITDYAPYSNICPISGRTGLSVWDDTKYGGTVAWNQLAPNNFSKIGSGTFAFTSGTRVVKGHKYILSAKRDVNTEKIVVNVYGQEVAGTNVISFNTLPTEGDPFRIGGELSTTVIKEAAVSGVSDGTLQAKLNNMWGYISSGATDTTITGLQIIDLTAMFGSTIADYIYSLEQNTAGAGVAWFRKLFPKPYYSYNAGETTCVSAVNGDPYWKKDIDWTTQAGTVYGGTLDVVTGVLTVTHGYVDLTTGMSGGSAGSGYVFYKALTNPKTVPNSQIAPIISEAYSAIRYNGVAANVNTIAIRDNGMVYVNTGSSTTLPVGSAVYKLATPLTYQLTPTQVEALVGTNNVWSDCGLITIVYALDEVPQNMPPSTAIFGDIFYTRRNQLSRFGLTFKGWNTVPDGSGEAWLPSGVSMGTYKRTEDAVWNVSHNVTLYAQWDPNVYPFGTVFFNGRNAQDLGIIVEELPSYYYAERAFNHKQVNGKNGDVILDTGRYENVKKVYKVACYDPSRNFYESAVALSTFLHSAGSDYIRLEDSYEPSSYRMAIYEETNEIENLLGKAGRCEITFNCMPQRFLLSGDEEITIPSSGYSIYNPTAFDAKPMIRIQGTGTVTINGRSVQVTENDNDMLVDCENQNAKDLSGADMNYFIYCDEFPILKPGFNTISYTETIDAVKITPRWWIL